MKKKILAVVLSLAMILPLVPAMVIPTFADGGNFYQGSENENTWHIANLAGLKEFRDSVNNGEKYTGKTVVLDANIEMDKVSWTPIDEFAGTFDGNSKTISGLYINNSTLDDAGLFGKTGRDSVIKNLTLASPEVTGRKGVGALAGTFFASEINNVKVTGTIVITGNQCVGGLAGSSSYTDVIDCDVTGSDKATSIITGNYDPGVEDGEGDNVGGLVGMKGPSDPAATKNMQATHDCDVSNLTLKGWRKVGGLFGQCYNRESTYDVTVNNIDVICLANTTFATAKEETMAFGGMVGIFAPISGDDKYRHAENSYLEGTVSNVTITCANEEVNTLTKMGVISGGQRGSKDFVDPTDTQFNVTVSGTNSTSSPKASSNTTSIYTAYTAPAVNVAQIGDAKYESLADAVAAVPDDGTKTTITMIADETLAVNATLTVAATKNIVLDLNGFTVTGSADTNAFYFITNEGTLEITDTSAGANGKITASTSNPDTGYSKENVTIYNCGGTLTLTAGKIENTTKDGATYAVNNSSNAWGSSVISTFNMTGGTISAPQGDAALRVYQNTGVNWKVYSKNYVNISGGTILDSGIFVDTVLYTKDQDLTDLTADDITKSCVIDTEINISGGTINGLIDMKIRHPFSTKLNITGGDFTNTKFRVRKWAGEYGADASAGTLAEPTEPMVKISGGRFGFVNAASMFNVSTGWTDTSSWSTYEAPYKVTGGKFNLDPTFVADGYEAVTNTDDDALTYGYKIGESNYAAQIGDAKYETLEAAIEAAQAGDTVVLLQNITLDAGATMGGNSTYGIVITKSITLDGNGKTITSNAPRTIGIMGTDDTVANYIDVTIKDLTVNNANDAGRGIQTWGDLKSLTLNNVVLNLTGTSGDIQPLTIAGGQATKATVTIIGGMISAAENANRGYAISTFNPVDMTINGTTVKGWACLNIKDAKSPGTGSAGSTFTIVDSTLISRNATPGPTNGYSMFAIEDDNVTINVTGTTMTVHGGDNNQSVVCFSYHSSNGNPIANHVTVTLGEGNTIALSGDASLEKIGWTNYSPDTWDNKLYIDAGVTFTFTYAGESVDLMDYIPATFTPAEDTTALNYAALTQPEIYYCWPVNEIDYQGVYCQSFYEPFEGPSSVLMDGERIDLRRDVTLDRNVTFTTVCSIGRSIAMSGGNFILNFGAHDITFGSYKIELPANVTMTTDKQLPLSVFSVASGYAVVETANGDGTYTYSVAPAVARIGDVKYATLEAAVEAAQSGDTIVLLDDITYGTDHTVAVWEKEFSIDLNGHTFTTESTQGITLSNAGFGATAICFGDTTSVANPHREITISNGTIRTAYGAGIYVDGDVKITLSDLDVKQNYPTNVQSTNEYSTAIRTTCEAVVIVESGSYEGKNAIVVSNSGGDVTVNGGTFKGDIYFSGSPDSNVTMAITLNGGYFNGSFVNPNNGTLTIKGGYFTADPRAYVADGYEAVAVNVTEGGVNYVWQVGEIIKAGDLTQAETPNTGYDATYSVKKQVVDANDNPIEGGDGTSRTVDVKVVTESVAVASQNTAEEILDNLDMDKVLGAVVDSVADTSTDISVEIQIVRDNPEIDNNNTITYEVHPEVIITVNNEPSDPVRVSNDALEAGALFTVKLPVPKKLADLVRDGNGYVKVTHTSVGYDASVKTYPLKGDVGNYYVQFKVSHFSQFELAVDTIDTIDQNDQAEWGATLSLEDMVAINVRVNNLRDRHDHVESDPSRFTVKYTFRGVTSVVPLTSATENKIVVARVAAKELIDEVTIELYYDGVLVKSPITYSVREYCMDTINDPASAEKLKTLCKALLEYGAAAQNRFNYKTEDLANTNLTEPAALSNVPAFTHTKNGTLTLSASLSLKENTQINVYFLPAAGYTSGDYTATVGGQSAKITASGSYGYIAIPGIAAKNLGANVTVVITNKNTSESTTLQYSPMTWAYNKQGTVTTELEYKIARTLYAYYLAAASYFASSN